MFSKQMVHSCSSRELPTNEQINSFLQDKKGLPQISLDQSAQQQVKQKIKQRFGSQEKGFYEKLIQSPQITETLIKQTLNSKNYYLNSANLFDNSQQNTSRAQHLSSQRQKKKPIKSINNQLQFQDAFKESTNPQMLLINDTNEILIQKLQLQKSQVNRKKRSALKQSLQITERKQQLDQGYQAPQMKELQSRDSFYSKSLVAGQFQQYSLNQNENQQNQEKNEGNESSMKFDSKLAEIKKLKEEKRMLESKVKTLQKDLAFNDQFNQVLRNSAQKGESYTFNEKRIDLLKAQIHKQQRYINILSKNLKLFRNLYTEMRSLLDWLIQVNPKFEQGHLVSLSEDEKNYKKNIDNLYNYYLNQQQEQASQISQAGKKELVAQNIIEIIKNNSNYKEFFDTFSKAYDQALKLQTDKDQNQYLFLYETQTTENIQQSSQKKAHKQSFEKISYDQQFQYKYPLKFFFESYKDIFSIKTIYFHLSKIQHKIQFETFLKKSILISNEINKSLYQIEQQQNFQNNPFFHRDQNYVLQNQNEFQTEHLSELTNYMTDNIKLKICLDYTQIMETEKSLSNLFTEIMQFHQNLIADKNQITILKVQQLNELISKCTENLLLLGMASNADSSEVVLGNMNSNEVHFQKKDKLIKEMEDCKEKEQIQEKVFVYKRTQEIELNYTKIYAELSKRVQNLIWQCQLCEPGKKFIEELQNIAFLLPKLETLYQQVNVTSNMNLLELTHINQYFHYLSTILKKTEDYLQEKNELMEQYMKTGTEHIENIEIFISQILYQQKSGKNRRVTQVQVENSLYFLKHQFENALKIEKFEGNNILKNIQNDFQKFRTELKSVWSYFDKNNKKFIEHI